MLNHFVIKLHGADNLSQSIRQTSFETLESLADLTMERLVDIVLKDNISCTHAKLTIEKPRAIAFADAPAVEYWKSMSSTADMDGSASNVKSETAQGSVEPRLNIIKPYV